jgi:hypothetical protein
MAYNNLSYEFSEKTSTQEKYQKTGAPENRNGAT